MSLGAAAAWAPVVAPVTWPCMVCGLTRTDDRISVISRKIGAPDKCVAQVNVRHCNDSEACRVGALKIADERIAKLAERMLEMGLSERGGEDGR